MEEPSSAAGNCTTCWPERKNSWARPPGQASQWKNIHQAAVTLKLTLQKHFLYGTWRCWRLWFGTKNDLKWKSCMLDHLGDCLKDTTSFVPGFFTDLARFGRFASFTCSCAASMCRDGKFAQSRASSDKFSSTLLEVRKPAFRQPLAACQIERAPIPDSKFESKLVSYWIDSLKLSEAVKPMLIIFTRRHLLQIHNVCCCNFTRMCCCFKSVVVRCCTVLRRYEIWRQAFGISS